MNDIQKLNEQLQQILNEMAPIVRDKYGKHIIKNIITNPDPGRNWFGEEYFKVFDSLDFNNKTKLARIKYREPIYVNHTGSNWTLNSKEKQDLINFLNEPNNKIPGISTNWQYAIYQFNMTAYEDSTMNDCMTTQKQLDCLPLNDKRKQYLPIDLEMPNYLEL